MAATTWRKLLIIPCDRTFVGIEISAYCRAPGGSNLPKRGCMDFDVGDPMIDEYPVELRFDNGYEFRQLSCQYDIIDG